jgi:hypothetical protein
MTDPKYAAIHSVFALEYAALTGESYGVVDYRILFFRVVTYRELVLIRFNKT